MPIYIYECEKCKSQFEVIQKMTDESFKIHNNALFAKVEYNPKEKVCNGKIHRVLQCPFVIFKGSGWTPTFGGKTGRSTKKIDQALKKLGVEDASDGWTKTEDKPKIQLPKKRGRKKYLGQLMVD